MVDLTDDETANYAVSIEDLFWIPAGDEEEAVEQVREKLMKLDDDEIQNLDLRVVDSER